ncbi:glycosyltransferase family 2 protein [Amnibacterium kyonggiense]
MKPLGIVVTTVGRRAALMELLESIAPDRESLAVAIAVQGGDARLAPDLEDAGRRLGLDLTVGRSSGGASAGRNDAAAWLDDRCRVLAFPNDTTRFPDGTVAALVRAVSDDAFRAGAMRVDDPYGAKFELPDPGTALDRRNVWSVILPGLLMRSDVFASIGGFDESIGTGAPTPWQSGEETAILLRHLESGAADFRWLPQIAVLNPHDTTGLDSQRRRRKLLGYARGYGRLIRTEHYGVAWFLRSLAAAVVFGARHGPDYSIVDGWWVLRGRIEGWTGRLPDSSVQTAIEVRADRASTRHARVNTGHPHNRGA